MAVHTKNSYGKLYITDESISAVAAHAALECYGVVDLVAKRMSDNLALAFKKKADSRGVRVTTIENKIFIDLYVVLKYGVSINAVAESLKRTVKYKVENFTGMIVDTVNINVLGVRV